MLPRRCACRCIGGSDRLVEEQRQPESRQHLIERIGATPGAVLDYAAVVDARSLQPVERLRGEILLAVAVKFGGTRLIDNLQLTLRS